jgi:hypothetical protein
MKKITCKNKGTRHIWVSRVEDKSQITMVISLVANGYVFSKHVIFIGTTPMYHNGTHIKNCTKPPPNIEVDNCGYQTNQIPSFYI